MINDTGAMLYRAGISQLWAKSWQIVEEEKRKTERKKEEGHNAWLLICWQILSENCTTHWQTDKFSYIFAICNHLQFMVLHFIWLQRDISEAVIQTIIIEAEQY